MILLSKSVVGSENLDTYKNDCYGTTEGNYFNCAAYFATLLNEYPTGSLRHQHHLKLPVLTTFSRKLPKLNVPTFSGEFSNWLSFKDLFQASVIKVDGLSNGENLQLLKFHVCGEAAELIKTIQTTDANFEIAGNTRRSLYCDG